MLKLFKWIYNLGYEKGWAEGQLQIRDEQDRKAYFEKFSKGAQIK